MGKPAYRRVAEAHHSDDSGKCTGEECAKRRGGSMRNGGECHSSGQTAMGDVTDHEAALNERVLIPTTPMRLNCWALYKWPDRVTKLG